ncbi:hypothetical protein [Halotalea alkalilenta]|nr:hypothetical protein [Halotalea alkalilenta]
MTIMDGSSKRRSAADDQQIKAFEQELERVRAISVKGYRLPAKKPR